MTLKQAKAQLRNVGISINKTVHGEYRVNFINGTEATATYETDILSAVDTGIAMAANAMRRGQRNPSYSRYGGREGSAEFRPMTLAEGKLLNYGDHIWFLDTKGSARRVKVNGRPQLWKRSPDRIRVPVKYGMYETGTFTEHDFGPGGRVLVPV